MNEDNKRLVMRVHEEVWNQGRVELIEELYVPHFRAHYPEPFSWSGLAGTREAHAMLKAAFPDWHETVDDIVAEGDRVATRFQSTGTHRGEFLGLAPTGIVVRVDEMAIFRIESGKLAEQWGAHDMLGLLRSLGAIPDA